MGVMGNIFGFMADFGNYESRKVARFDADWGFVSTAEISDSDAPFETAVCHSSYRDDGKMVIVENYYSREDAEAGHAKWVKKMTAKRLPKKLVEAGLSGIGQLCNALGGPEEYPRRD